MNVSANSFISVLESQNLKYGVEEREGDTVVTCGMKMDNTTVRVNCFIDNDNAHVALRCFGFISVPENKFAEVLLTCNECNMNYRWVKFYIDNSSDLTAADDAVVSPETAGTEIFELMLRMLNIVDGAYPQFMKGIWS